MRAIVFGGGSGIGLASARLLARDGAVVTITGRTEAKLLEARERLSEEGLDVTAFAADGMEAADVRAAVSAAADAEGHLHIAVSVPGGGSIRPILLVDDDQFDDEVRRNTRPVFLLLKYAGRAMVRAGGGSFVAVSSTAATMTSRYLASYCAGKAAVDQLVRVAADELGRLHVRVNAVRPGMTHTGATAGAFTNEPMMRQFLDNQPLPRHGEADDQAQAVRYLAGPESNWVTGQLLTVDGGHTLRAFIDYATLLDLPDQGDPANFT